MVLVTGPANPVNTSYSGYIYAITARGGFSINQTLSPIRSVVVANPIFQYDVTNSLQFYFDVNIFNSKLGSFNNGFFENDTITISASEFLQDITASNIISLGLFSNFYSNFISSVNNYFNYANGFLPIFSSQYNYTTNGTNYSNSNSFNSNAFIEFINSRGAENISNLSGSITISNINNIIKYAVNNNVFNNRDGKTASDGFVDGDFIFINQGIVATLSLDLEIDANGVSLSNILSQTYTDFSSNYVTIATLSNIRETVNVPLLFRLSNFD
jgi:hypothetical protein